MFRLGTPRKVEVGAPPGDSGKSRGLPIGGLMCQAPHLDVESSGWFAMRGVVRWWWLGHGRHAPTEVRVNGCRGDEAWQQRCETGDSAMS